MPKRKPLDATRLRKLYITEEKTPREIAIILGVSFRHIRAELKRYEIPLRNKKESIVISKKYGRFAKKGGKDNPNYKHGYSGRYGKYNITEQNFLSQLREQDHKCAICATEISITKSHIDHCHTTQQLRGILCSDCNIGLGFFKDNTFSLEKAIEYLQQARWSK